MKGRCGKRVAVLGLLLAGSSAWAGIEWEQARQDVRVAPGEGRARVSFRFRNTGEGAVTLERIATDCRCTADGDGLRAYGPGESGALALEIVFGSDWGRHPKRIRVKTDESGGPWHTLEVVGIVRSPVTIRPRFVWWQRGEAAQPRTVEVLAEEPGPLALTRVSCAEPRVRIAREVVEPDRRYRLVISPAATAEAFNATVEIETQSADAAKKVHQVYVSVK